MKTKRKIILIVVAVIIIILIIGLWFIFAPSIKVVGNLGKINGTSYSLEKTKNCIAYNGNCKINIYPTEHLKEIDLVQNVKSEKIIYLCVNNNPDKGAINISVIPTNEASGEFVTRMKEITNAEPNVSREYNTLNYFVYNGKNISII